MRLQASMDATARGSARPGLWSVFVVFLKVGSLSFGGPYAILSYIEKETVERRGWLSAEDFARGVGIGHLTPGPIAFSSAVYAGHRIRGWPGALIAALGLILPSFFIAVAFAIGYGWFAGVPAVRPVLLGFNAAVIGLLVAIVLKMGKGVVHSWPKSLLAVSAFAALMFKVNPALIVVGAALVALILGTRIVPGLSGGDKK
jgi:chromate transporter